MKRDQPLRSDLSVISLTPEALSPSPLPSAAFPCLLWNHDGRCSADQRDAVARALVLGGCRYAVCGGLDCDSWEAAFDEAGAAADGPGQHVMTTSHQGETASEVAFFFASCTNFDDYNFKELLVVHVGSGPRTLEVEQAVRAELRK